MEESHWVFQLLGRLHPMVVHFPIGLLVVALFFELLTIRGKRPSLREGIKWMLYLGAFFAMLSALFGWLLKTEDDYSGQLVENHQNVGIATAAFAILSVFLLSKSLKGKLSSFLVYRISLVITVLLLTVAGHLGSSITHGEDYLTNVFLNDKSENDNDATALLLTKLKDVDSLSMNQQDKLNLGVRAIFAHNCYQCHSENKRKGGLELDNKEGVYKGGESGVIIVEGKPQESELFRRVSLSPNDDEVMPKKGKVLKPNEIALIKLWIKNGAHWSDQALKVFPEADLALTRPNLPKGSLEEHPVDKLIDEYFKKKDISWPEKVNDHMFVRRAYLDVVGLLPSPSEVTSFIENQNPHKRDVLINKLLNDTTNYTQHWLTFWNDLLRNDYSGPGFITGGRKQITNWLYRSLEQNKPYDEMVKELINPTAESEGFIKGIQWRGVVNASQRTEMQAAQNIGQSLLGVNVKCASCHNSFVSNLTLEESYGFAAIFADSVLELNRCDKPIGKMAKVSFLYPELGDVNAETVMERLALLSEVIIKPENGRMYRTLVNRIWKKFMGRGIVEPVDEMDKEPWDANILDWLASDFIDSGHDLKHLMRQILSSKTYQLATAKYSTLEAIKGDYVFQGPLVRRLSAEQFSDAVSKTIAPLYPTVEYDPTGKILKDKRFWHREVKFDRTVLPEPGTRYFRQQIKVPIANIEKALVLISVDHSYALQINGEEVGKGNNWREVDKIEVSKYLIPGNNTVAIIANNEGTIANPAGILFGMRLYLENGEEIDVDSDKNWKSTDVLPDADWVQINFDDSEWKETQNYGSANWGKLVEFNFDNSKQQIARASLVKQHPFMKALGRPSRENVTTTRDEQATLLQALELTNGEYFNVVLNEGATFWLNTIGNKSEKITENLYQKLLGRSPTSMEKKIITDAFGSTVNKETVQDLFWTVLVLPEFQFIY
ncbi:DUF1549 domain-containing protein [Aurantibacter sp.]|uniref:DUF1549 domain-containing protein n=1 Tax=Aurantibacter sp. TaxID=2807103 RepID=UPI0032664366